MSKIMAICEIIVILMLAVFAYLTIKTIEPLLTPRGDILEGVSTQMK